MKITKVLKVLKVVKVLRLKASKVQKLKGSLKCYCVIVDTIQPPRTIK